MRRGPGASNPNLVATMYIPRSYAESRPEVQLDFIEAHPFGALVTNGEEGLFATHLPFIVARERGVHGVLQGHIARANPHHRQVAGGADAMVIFSGPNAYVTPSWYPSKAEHGKVVPTWNYVAVHAYGTLRFIDDPAFLRPHLELLVARHEADRDLPWAIRDAPGEYIDQLERAIVGLELEVTRLEGKWKMSQNRSAEDVDGVVRGLAGSPDADERSVAAIVQARRPGGAQPPSE